MRLSDELKSEFAKLISKPEKQTEAIMYGTIAIRDNIMYVNLDGSDILTPITTTTSVKDGDRVTVLIKNHTAMVTGNLSSPSSSSSEVDEIRTKVNSIEAITANIDDIVADNVYIKEHLTANEAYISELQTDNISIKETLEANTAKISKLETNKLDAQTANITFATIKNLEATNADIYNLRATYAEFSSTTTTRLDAVEATIDSLDVGNLEATYAKIDFANVNTASITQGFLSSLMVSQGLLSDRVVSEEVTVTNCLTGVHILANDIIAGTIDASVIDVKNLNCSNLTVGTINGTQISDNAITTSKVADDAITTDKIVAEAITSTQIAASAITSNKIAANAVTASHILVDSLSALSANLGTVTAGVIRSDNYVYNESLDKTTSGMEINLSSSTIRAKNFGIYSDGSTMIKGDIYANSLYADAVTIDGNLFSIKGVIGGDLIEKTILSIEGNQASSDSPGTCEFKTDLGSFMFLKPITCPDNSVTAGSISSQSTISATGAISSKSTISANGSIITKYNYAFRSIRKGKSVFLYNNGTYFYIMLSDTETGKYNSLRPFTITQSSGLVTIGNGLAVSGGLTVSGGLKTNAGLNYIYSHGGNIVSLAAYAAYMEVIASDGVYGITWWESDERLKKNIEKSEVNALDVIKDIEHYSFDWKDESRGSIKLGYVAQQLEEVEESFVLKIKQKDGDYTYQIDDTHLIPYITKSIQELYEENMSMKNEIQELKNLVSELSKKIV